MSWMWSQRGSPAGTHNTLSSPPPSSTILNMPTGRASTITPGKTDSGSSTSASNGSPSSPSVFSMKP
ncbi:Uncharacterised protein [Mycobacteroides abscessus subsp. abscessus]|nr:Uncharacterised protein [Mycobacteroides abscessus subsp. abscessus]